jgi:transposase
MQQAVDYKALYESQLVQIELLKAELAQLKRMIFGSKSENFLPATSTAQLTLDIQAEAIATTSVVGAKKIAYTRIETQTKPVSHPVRMKLPDHLERKEIVHEPAGLTEGCRRIGEEVTEELEYEPGKLFVNRFVRPKYVSADSTTVLIAPMIERPLPKAIAGPGLLTQIIIDKYIDHLPLHRQQQRFSREKINIPYSTITDWVSNTCKLIAPLYDALVKEVLACNYLHADETPIKVLDKDKKGETHRGYYWVYHNSLKDLVLFDYQLGRGREGPSEMLKDFKGHLQTDGYVAYNIFDRKEDITLFHCWAHARRKFYDAQDSDTGRATHALQQIQLLYAIERKAKEQSLNEEEILMLRKKEAVPILNKLQEWMKQTYIEVLPKSPMGKAIGYSLERWAQLLIYTTDGKLNIDNNPVENAIRPVAIGRKNYLFAGSHEAAQRSAMLYSLLGSCKLHGINPSEWMKNVLERIATHPINQVHLLLPHNLPAGRQGWKAAQ